MKNYFNEKIIKPSDLFWVGIISSVATIVIAYINAEEADVTSAIPLIGLGIIYSVLPNLKRNHEDK